MTIYPSATFEDDYKNQTPLIFAVLVAISFVLMAATFFIYDMFVQIRNTKLVSNAARSNAIVSSLFPGHIRDKFIELNTHTAEKNFKNPFSRRNSESNCMKSGSAPIADLFLETTVLFADIVGFTAWASVYEPSQVFTLLETLYAAFDGIARKRQVFKVETVGDCYVAVCGLPDPRADHAVVIVRYARCILERMYALTRELEVTLGPDTGDLSLRIGIHSGPVIAGVLRGDRARFQLFGDTVNTTARIESSGRPGRVHVSQETADYLVKAGKGHWLVKRPNLVHAKGKPELQTYWVRNDNSADVLEDDTVSAPEEATNVEVSADRQERLIDWNVKTLLRLIKQVVLRRDMIASQNVKEECAPASSRIEISEELLSPTILPLEEVVDIITLPEFSQSGDHLTRNLDDVDVSVEAIQELRQFVVVIASMYRDNAFHNFEHASHVTMSVIKMLSRVVAPSDFDLGNHQQDKVKTLHDHTYGITSDPLTQLACAVTALIHDVDHVGVPNAQLIKEQDPLVAHYGKRSVLEQNSLDLSWNLFMDVKYKNLRKTICSSNRELAHFRQLLVNGVMATDIVDNELKKLRNERWDLAFAKGKDLGEMQQANPLVHEASTNEEKRNSVNRKATIVIEHLIQASDVSHTMQHWHVYRKWNESFFRECYAAYIAGRTETNPADNWYRGEIGFFDFYIIPLTRKLKDCGVFGKSSDEFLNYALTNRKEWELRGQLVVAEMVEKIASKEQGAYPPVGHRRESVTEAWEDCSTSEDEVAVF